MIFPVDTERLRLRAIVTRDWAFIRTLLNSPGWLRFIGDRKVHTKAEAVSYIEKGPMANYRQLGFGTGLVELKATGKPIGMCGLLQRPFLPVPDIGFAYLEEYTGKGYGYEAAHGLLLHLAATKRFQHIMAFCQPDNQPSAALLLKLGFQPEDDLWVDGDPQPKKLFSFFFS